MAPCQPMAKSHPKAAGQGLICDGQEDLLTRYEAEILLTPARGKLGDPVILPTGGRRSMSRYC